MQRDEQIEFWISQMKEIVNDSSRTRVEEKSYLDDLEEQIKDRMDDPKLKFEDEYLQDVMGRVVDIRGVESLPS
jgi:hypothetical protein